MSGNISYILLIIDIDIQWLRVTYIIQITHEQTINQSRQVVIFNQNVVVNIKILSFSNSIDQNIVHYKIGWTRMRYLWNNNNIIMNVFNLIISFKKVCGVAYDLQKFLILLCKYKSTFTLMLFSTKWFILKINNDGEKPLIRQALPDCVIEEYVGDRLQSM